MIIITYGQIRQLNGNVPLMQKLLNTPLRQQTSYELKKIFDALKKHGKVIYEEYEKEILPIMPKGEDAADLAKVEEYNKAVTLFEQRMVRIDRKPIPMEWISDIKLSVVEHALLEPLVVEPAPEPVAAEPEPVACDAVASSPQ